MTKYILFSLMIVCGFLLSSSNRIAPQQYLDKAVLNSNKITGFAGKALSQELANPPVKTGRHGESIVVSRQVLIEAKIRFSQSTLHDLESMYPTPDAIDIVTGGIALHQFVIEVYKTDYMALAKLYDEGAPQEKILALDEAIRDKHASMFELHYENLLRGGKLYAARHHLKTGPLTNQF